MMDESFYKNKIKKWLPRRTLTYANITAAHGLLMAAKAFIATRCLFEAEDICCLVFLGRIPAIYEVTVIKQTHKMMRLDAPTLSSTTPHLIMPVAYRILQPRPQIALRASRQGQIRDSLSPCDCERTFSPAMKMCLQRLWEGCVLEMNV